MNLQKVIDEHLFPDDTNVCLFCSQDEKESKKLTRAPNFFIMQIPRTKCNGEKDEVKIKCSTGRVTVGDGKVKQAYTVDGVITHQGTVDNGHYTYSHYLEL